MFLLGVDFPYVPKGHFLGTCDLCMGGGAAVGGAEGSGGDVALLSCLLFVCAGLEGPQQQELC